MRKTKPIDAKLTHSSPDLDARREAVLRNYEELREFYQGQTTFYGRMFIGLQVATLTGSALTPILLLMTNLPKVWQALPSAIGGLAAAVNGAFRYRQEWA